MKCSNPGCNRGIGLIADQRGWFSRGHLFKASPDTSVADAPNLQQPQECGSQALCGRIRRIRRICRAVVPATLTIAVLAAAPARPETSHLPGCDRDLTDASASVVAMRVRIKSLSGLDRSEICTNPVLFFGKERRTQ